MGHNTASRIKCVVDGVIQQIRDISCINVCKSKESPREVGWIVVGAKHAAKLLVEDLLRVIAQEISFVHPLRDCPLGIIARTILHILD